MRGPQLPNRATTAGHRLPDTGYRTPATEHRTPDTGHRYPAASQRSSGPPHPPAGRLGARGPPHPPAARYVASRDASHIHPVSFARANSPSRDVESFLSGHTSRDRHATSPQVQRSGAGPARHACRQETAQGEKPGLAPPVRGEGGGSRWGGEGELATKNRGFHLSRTDGAGRTVRPVPGGRLLGRNASTSCTRRDAGSTIGEPARSWAEGAAC